MRDRASIEAVDAARFGPSWLRPLYETYSFSQIPHAIPSLFDAPNDAADRLLGKLSGRYRIVILLFLDAFGWRFFEQYAEQYPFLRRFCEHGIVTKLTSQFPSTTTAHVTDIHSGRAVGESGLYEWFTYEPSIKDVIAPLFFSIAGNRRPNTLVDRGVAPEDIFPSGTIYQRLAEAGVRSHVFQHQSIAGSPPTRVLTRGARGHAFASLQEGVRDLVDTVLGERGSAYYFLYFGGIDTAGHAHGPASRQFASQIELVFSTLESILHTSLAGAADDTLLLLTADHGMIHGEPGETIYLNEVIPESAEWLRARPSGYSRDMVLHVHEEALPGAEAQLRECLDGIAEVRRIPDLIADGFFGTVGPALLDRIGDLMILPLGERLVWWRGGPATEFRGYHGGLSVEEMETEILSLAYT